MDKYKNTSLFDKPVGEMSDAEREAAIAELLDMRRAVTAEIEEIMQRATEETRDKRFVRRKYRRGKSPNDI